MGYYKTTDPAVLEEVQNIRDQKANLQKELHEFKAKYKTKSIYFDVSLGTIRFLAARYAQPMDTVHWTKPVAAENHTQVPRSKTSIRSPKALKVEHERIYDEYYASTPKTRVRHEDLFKLLGLDVAMTLFGAHYKIFVLNDTVYFDSSSRLVITEGPFIEEVLGSEFDEALKKSSAQDRLWGGV